MAREMGRSTCLAMNPSVSLTRARKRRRSATRISAGTVTTSGSTPSGSAVGGPNRRVSRSCTAGRLWATPSASSALSASATIAAGITIIRPGAAAQPAASMPISARRSSQPVSPRTVMGAMSSGPGSPARRTAASPLQSAIVAMPGGAVCFAPGQIRDGNRHGRRRGRYAAARPSPRIFRSARQPLRRLMRAATRWELGTRTMVGAARALPPILGRGAELRSGLVTGFIYIQFAVDNKY